MQVAGDEDAAPERILGLLVAAIGMQFIVSGTTDTIVNVIAPAIFRLH